MIWPMWMDDKSVVSRFTRIEYDLVQAFDSGYNKWMINEKKKNKGRKPRTGDEEVFTGMPGSLAEELDL